MGVEGLFGHMGCFVCQEHEGTSGAQSERKWSLSVVSDSLQPMDCSLPGSSVHGIFQARVLEWVAISFSRGSSQLRDRTQVSHIAGRRFTREAQCKLNTSPNIHSYG